eukprot:TRINITY_DN6522_c0_g1_i1.p1 TRINITY_DN6522_c0_g1~~TRINITY_DN6522_c0_g1_i1.p1  ORF type:complete len:293 (+),score=82.60 TRINITY_DN6522_c0_g1_i1:53-880(+)
MVRPYVPRVEPRLWYLRSDAAQYVHDDDYLGGEPEEDGFAALAVQAARADRLYLAADHRAAAALCGELLLAVLRYYHGGTRRHKRPTVRIMRLCFDTAAHCYNKLGELEACAGMLWFLLSTWATPDMPPPKPLVEECTAANAAVLPAFLPPHPAPETVLQRVSHNHDTAPLLSRLADVYARLRTPAATRTGLAAALLSLQLDGHSPCTWGRAAALLENASYSTLAAACAGRAAGSTEQQQQPQHCDEGTLLSNEELAAWERIVFPTPSAAAPQPV